MTEVFGQLLGDFASSLGGFFQRDLGLVLLDCLDILLVAILIYWVLVVLRGTRAMQGTGRIISLRKVDVPTLGAGGGFIGKEVSVAGIAHV